LSARSLPQQLQSAIEGWIAGEAGALRQASAQLRGTYERAGSSSDVTIAAYLAARLPATFAALSRVFELASEVMPDFVPSSILDIGAGPGTASWAAVESWPELGTITMVERDARFAALAQDLAQSSGHQALKSAKVELAEMGRSFGRADLVVAAYVLAEQQLGAASGLALKLWEDCDGLLVIVEPGTPEGFARIRAARAALLHAGAHMVAPCPGAENCPMTGGDWCHFKTRLQRSRLHMQAKGATVPFEDESFSFVVVSRQKTQPALARIIAPVDVSKVSATLRLCTHGGVEERVVASRDKPAYKLAKKKSWGDGWE
jgi:ribosomal protein RSM22 (predicted rRNA methylase)